MNQTLADEHMSLVHPDGSECPDGCDAAAMPSYSELLEQRNELRAALKSTSGYLMNAKIDLETGAPKRTAINTIEGGLKIAQSAIAKATGGVEIPVPQPITIQVRKLNLEPVMLRKQAD
jgi:hypothetical protein